MKDFSCSWRRLQGPLIAACDSFCACYSSASCDKISSAWMTHASSFNECNTRSRLPSISESGSLRCHLHSFMNLENHSIDSSCRIDISMQSPQRTRTNLQGRYTILFDGLAEYRESFLPQFEELAQAALYGLPNMTFYKS